MSFDVIRAGSFSFNFKNMRVHKIRTTWEPWRQDWDPVTLSFRTRGKEREEIISKYILLEKDSELQIQLLDVSKKEVCLKLSDFLKQEDVDEVLKAWTDYIFERELLRSK